MSDLLIIAREGQLLEGYSASLTEAMRAEDLDAIRDALDNILIVIAHTQSDILRAKALRVVSSLNPALSDEIQKFVQRHLPGVNANPPEAT